MESAVKVPDRAAACWAVPIGQVTEVAVRILYRHAGIADFNSTIGHFRSDVAHNGRNRRTGFAAFQALIGQGFQQAGHGLHVLPCPVQGGGAVLVGLAQLVGSGVAVGLGVGQHVGKAAGLRGFQPKSRKVVGHHVRSSCQIHAGGRCQVQYAGQGRHGLVGIPAGQRHVAQGIRSFAGAESGGLTGIQRRLPQLGELFLVGTGQGLDLAH